MGNDANNTITQPFISSPGLLPFLSRDFLPHPKPGTASGNRCFSRTNPYPRSFSKGLSDACLSSSHPAHCRDPFYGLSSGNKKPLRKYYKVFHLTAGCNTNIERLLLFFWSQILFLTVVMNVGLSKLNLIFLSDVS